MLDLNQQRTLCRNFLKATFGADFKEHYGFDCYFELWKNYDKQTNGENGTFYVCHAPYVTKHDDTTFICVGETYEEAKQKAISQLRNCFEEKDIDFQFSLCEVEQYKSYYFIYN